MRKLIYIPILHVSADLGLMAEEVETRGRNITGDISWEKHQNTVLGFWSAVAQFFGSLDVKGFKLYQDGMVANGEMGQKIMEEGKKKGSKNLEIVSRLIDQGAQLIQTEEFQLVKKEYDHMKKISKKKSLGVKLLSFLIYKFHKKRFLEKRDRYISQRIDETLNEGETGILFLGAEHEIKSKLPEDLEVLEVKEREKIREYRKRLLTKKNKEELIQLGRYLKSPVKLRL
ncbi:hypothetical protein KGY73_08710 [bacterium]|nr:hypothetical protein [bacterium]